MNARIRIHREQLHDMETKLRDIRKGKVGTAVSYITFLVGRKTKLRVTQNSTAAVSNEIYYVLSTLNCSSVIVVVFGYMFVFKHVFKHGALGS